VQSKQFIPIRMEYKYKTPDPYVSQRTSKAKNKIKLIL